MLPMRSNRPHYGRAGVCATALLIAFSARAEDAAAPATQPLPNPLTLEQAVALADASHPALDLAAAALDAVRARARAVEAGYGLDLRAEIRPYYADPAGEGPPPTGGDAAGDSQAHLILTKPLYDFGKRKARNASARAQEAGGELSFLDARQRQRLEVTRLFFDVLLADMRYMVDNEAMAHAYVNYDRVRQRHELGRISAVDMAEAETNYRDFFNRRAESDVSRRVTRARLAAALNRPTDLPADLTRPDLPGNDRKAPEYEELMNKVLASNPGLQAMRQQLEAAEQAVQVARAGARPQLDAEAQASAWERAFGARNSWQVGLNLRIPLYQGGRNSAAVAESAAQRDRIRAETQLAEYRLRQTTLELLQQLEVLQVQRDSARIRSNFRDLYLDRSRAIYEMEAQVSMGDAMTKLTEAQWLAARVEFDLAMVWAQLDALQGKLLATNNGDKAP
jgi:outer membrane protein TolC